MKRRHGFNSLIRIDVNGCVDVVDLDEFFFHIIRGGCKMEGNEKISVDFDVVLIYFLWNSNRL